MPVGTRSRVRILLLWPEVRISELRPKKTHLYTSHLEIGNQHNSKGKLLWRREEGENEEIVNKDCCCIGYRSDDRSYEA